jgi:hypothetical protein
LPSKVLLIATGSVSLRELTISIRVHAMDCRTIQWPPHTSDMASNEAAIPVMRNTRFTNVSAAADIPVASEVNARVCPGRVPTLIGQ